MKLENRICNNHCRFSDTESIHNLPKKLLKRTSRTIKEELMVDEYKKQIKDIVYPFSILHDLMMETKEIKFYENQI